MKYYSCTCDASQWFGSDPPPPCAKCDRCGTGPGGREPNDHNWYGHKVETDAGDGVLTRCRWCMCKKPKD